MLTLIAATSAKDEHDGREPDADREEDDDSGDDILDEPHDATDEGDDEPNLGRVERFGEGGGTYAGHEGDGALLFEGDGYHDANDLLRKQGLPSVRVSPGYGN